MTGKFATATAQTLLILTILLTAKGFGRAPVTGESPATPSARGNSSPQRSNLLRRNPPTAKNPLRNNRVRGAKKPPQLQELEL